MCPLFFLDGRFVKSIVLGLVTACVFVKMRHPVERCFGKTNFCENVRATPTSVVETGVLEDLCDVCGNA